MNRVTTQSLFSCVCLAACFLAATLNTQQATAIDIATVLTNDATAAELALSYKVVVVRDAIAKCRTGNFDEALPVLREYAAANDIGACYVLANLHLEGLGVEQSGVLAAGLLSKNVTSGHTPSMVKLAQLKEADAPAEAMELYKRASAAKDVLAHVKLGRVFENGMLGTSKNGRLAFKYYEKAHKEGSPLGVYHVARCYDEGIGVSSNSLESTRLFRQAALAGVPIANTVMARRYFDGKGVEPDPVAAIGWLMRGAQAGSAAAMVLLGQRYEVGDVIGQDLNRAGQLYSGAAKQGDPTGRYRLAQLYFQGTGTKKDVVRAYVLLSGAQALPKAKQQFEKLTKELTVEQLELARKKIAEEAGR